MLSFVIPFKLLVVVVVSVVLLSYTICKAVTAEWLVPIKIRIRAGQIIPDLLRRHLQPVMRLLANMCNLLRSIRCSLLRRLCQPGSSI